MRTGDVPQASGREEGRALSRAAVAIAARAPPSWSSHRERTKSRPRPRTPAPSRSPEPTRQARRTYVESFLVQKRPPGHSSWSCTARPRLLLIWASCRSDSASRRSA